MFSAIVISFGLNANTRTMVSAAATAKAEAVFLFHSSLFIISTPFCLQRIQHYFMVL